MERRKLDLSYYESFDRLSTNVLSMVERLLQVKTIWISHLNADNICVLKMLHNGVLEVRQGTPDQMAEWYGRLIVPGQSAASGVESLFRSPQVPTATLPGMTGIGAFIGLPLILRNGHAFGSLCAIDPESMAFTEDDVNVISSMAKFLSYALDLEHSMIRDPLTGLFNRDFLHRYLESPHHLPAVGHDQTLALLLCDLDNFRVYNDTLGHTAGNQLLQAVADRLQQTAGLEHIVARVGGDEFAILLSFMSDPQESVLVAETVLQSLSRPFSVGGKEVYISTSIGISFYPIHGSTMDDLIKHADTAMYRAKEEGRNIYRFYRPKMTDTYSRRLELEHALRIAVQQEQFRLVYQPQVNPETKRIIGVEALLRWEHAELGSIAPSEFIPLAEDTGLILPLGEWALRTAVAQNKSWQNAGFQPIFVSVNLSVRQFHQGSLVDTVSRALKESDLDPAYLLIELSESIGLQCSESVITTLHGLKSLGIQISIDDFGTGFSSLSYLKRFPVDMLKIDRSFVADISRDAQDATIVKAIVELARGLNLNVIAEGIETEDQLEALSKHPCDAIQGFLFGRPVPCEEIESLLSPRNMQLR